MRKCLGKHSCMSFSFPLVILNDTSLFPTVQLQVHKKNSLRDGDTSQCTSNPVSTKLTLALAIHRVTAVPSSLGLVIHRVTAVQSSLGLVIHCVTPLPSSLGLVIHCVSAVPSSLGLVIHCFSAVPSSLGLMNS